MTDSTDGAWKSPAKTSALWSNKEPESHREKYGWKRERWGEARQREAAREGEKEGAREREEGGEGGACLKKVACPSAKSVFVGRVSC